MNINSINKDLIMILSGLNDIPDLKTAISYGNSVLALIKLEKDPKVLQESYKTLLRLYDYISFHCKEEEAIHQNPKTIVFLKKVRLFLEQQEELNNSSEDSKDFSEEQIKAFKLLKDLFPSISKP